MSQLRQRSVCTDLKIVKRMSYTLQTYDVEHCNHAGPFTIQASWVGEAMEAAERRGLGTLTAVKRYPDGRCENVTNCVNNWYRDNAELVEGIRKG